MAFKMRNSPLKGLVSAFKHKANYPHPESMHKKGYSPKMMDEIKKNDPNATFEDKKTKWNPSTDKLV